MIDVSIVWTRDFPKVRGWFWHRVVAFRGACAHVKGHEVDRKTELVYLAERGRWMCGALGWWSSSSRLVPGERYVSEWFGPVEIPTPSDVVEGDGHYGFVSLASVAELHAEQEKSNA